MIIFLSLLGLFGREVGAFQRSFKDLTQNTFEPKLHLQRNFLWMTQSSLQLR